MIPATIAALPADSSTVELARANATVGAGMLNFALRRAKNIHRHTHAVDKPARAAVLGRPVGVGLGQPV